MSFLVKFIESEDATNDEIFCEFRTPLDDKHILKGNYNSIKEIVSYNWKGKKSIKKIPYKNHNISFASEYNNHYSCMEIDDATSLWEYLQVEKGFVVNER